MLLGLAAKSCPALCDPSDYKPSGSSVHGGSPGKNTRMSSHALLQGIFPTQGSKPGLPHCRRILCHLSHQGSPRKLEWDPTPKDIPDPGIEPGSPALQVDSSPAELPGKHTNSLPHLRWIQTGYEIHCSNCWFGIILF